MKSSLINIAKNPCLSHGINWAAQALVKIPIVGGSQLRVLTYHRVDYPANRHDLDPSLISAVPEQFERQLRCLGKYFDFVSLQDVLRAKYDGAKLPKRPLLLTFDDAYQDFLLHALPVLKRFSAPSVLFVPTAYPGMIKSSFWWDRLHCALQSKGRFEYLKTSFGRFMLDKPLDRQRAFKHLKELLKLVPDEILQHEISAIEDWTGSAGPAPAVLTWDELRTVSKAGVTVAPHTHTHPLLDRVSFERVIEELKVSREIIMSEIGECPQVFAYPSGHYDDAAVDALQQEGFLLGFTTMRGLNRLEIEHPLKLRRNNVASRTPDGLVMMQLSGTAGFLNKKMPRRFAPRMPNYFSDFTIAGESAQN